MDSRWFCDGDVLMSVTFWSRFKLHEPPPAPTVQMGKEGGTWNLERWKSA